LKAAETNRLRQPKTKGEVMEPETVQQPEGRHAPGTTGPESALGDLENRLDALVEARLDAIEERRRLAERATLTERFVADNPDFRELLASGALAAQKRDNPLLDDMGAYYAHRLAAERQVAEQALAKARAEAATEAEDRALERFRTKRLAQTLSAAPAGAGRGEGVAPELAAPEKFGGLNAVLAARLEARRKSAGN
jgi:hypothetical protein